MKRLETVGQDRRGRVGERRRETVGRWPELCDLVSDSRSFPRLLRGNPDSRPMRVIPPLAEPDKDWECGLTEFGVLAYAWIDIKGNAPQNASKGSSKVVRPYPLGC